LGRATRSIVSELYADQNERDHATLRKVVKAKRIKAETGV
jgi:hypothetical protein